jgi:hypothetical protein
MKRASDPDTGASWCGASPSLRPAGQQMTRSCRTILCSFAIGLGLSGPAAAQVPFSACLDRQLHPIPGRVDNTMAAGAEATIEDGHPVILWNQHNLSQVSGSSQLFVYLHECAHHNLNHVFKAEGRSVEDQADCWAYQLLVDGGMLDGSHLDELTRDLRHWPGDINHLGGEALLAGLRDCLAIRTDQTAWNQALTTLTAAAGTRFQDLRGPPIPQGPPGTFEVTQGTPGTYDCELIQPPAVRCMVFAARKQKAAEKRFRVLTEIISHWVTPDWTSTQPPSTGPGLAKSFVAQDTRDGTLLLLGLTPGGRIYFMVRSQAPS